VANNTFKSLEELFQKVKCACLLILNWLTEISGVEHALLQVDVFRQ
jgi:hypothetical protein